MLKSYLEGRTQPVRVSDVSSSTLRSNVGVPQGSILGPLIFSLHINALPSVCNGCDIQTHADDTVNYVHAKNKEQAALKLTSTMTNITKCLSVSCLHLNVKNTYCMFFTKMACKVSPEPDVHVVGERLQVVSDLNI